MSEEKIHGIRTMPIDSIQATKFGLKRKFLYWETLFKDLAGRWVNIQDMIMTTEYARSTILAKIRELGYSQTISKDKEWVYFEKRSKPT